MKLTDKKLEQVNGGLLRSGTADRDCKCLKCGRTFNVSLKPYICPVCGELKEGEYEISTSGRDEAFVA